MKYNFFSFKKTTEQFIHDKYSKSRKNLLFVIKVLSFKTLEQQQ